MAQKKRVKKWRLILVLSILIVFVGGSVGGMLMLVFQTPQQQPVPKQITTQNESVDLNSLIQEASQENNEITTEAETNSWTTEEIEPIIEESTTMTGTIETPIDPMPIETESTMTGNTETESISGTIIE